MNHDAKFTVKLENLKKNVAERQITRVVQLPFWDGRKWGTPNSFLRSALFSAIQSKDRVWLKREILFSQQGIVIKFTGEQLNQEDLTLWEALVHFYKEQPLGDTIEFTAYEMLKLLELGDDKNQYQTLHNGIIRLAECSVHIEHKDMEFFGSLVESGLKDKASKRYTLKLSKELIKLYGNDKWTAVDTFQRIDLRRKPLAQTLHAYYSSHETPYSVTLDFLQKMSGSRNSQLASFKRQVRSALTELVAIGFLQDYSVVGNLVSVRRITILLK